MFNPLVAQSTVHDFFSDAKFEIRIRPVILPENVIYEFAMPLTTVDGINYTMSGTDIKCLLANTTNTNDDGEREVAAYFTGGFNQNKVEAALGTSLDPLEVAKAREIQIDIWPWEEASEPIEFPPNP